MLDHKNIGIPFPWWFSSRGKINLFLCVSDSWGLLHMPRVMEKSELKTNGSQMTYVPGAMMCSLPPKRRGGIMSHEIDTFAFSLCSPRGRKAWLLVFGVFLKLELCWSPKRGLRSVFSLKFGLQRKSSPDGRPHILAVFLGLGDQKTGDAS